MAKIGISINVDVTKLDKDRFFVGEKGTYADMTCFIDLDGVNKAGKNGVIVQQKDKDEDVEMPIIGSVKIFWDNREPEEESYNPAPRSQGKTQEDDPTIPF